MLTARMQTKVETMSNWMFSPDNLWTQEIITTENITCLIQSCQTCIWQYSRTHSCRFISNFVAASVWLWIQSLLCDFPPVFSHQFHFVLCRQPQTVTVQENEHDSWILSTSLQSKLALCTKCSAWSGGYTNLVFQFISQVSADCFSWG